MTRQRKGRGVFFKLQSLAECRNKPGKTTKFPDTVFERKVRRICLSHQIIFEWSETDFVKDVLLKIEGYIFDTIVFFLYLSTFS